MLEQPLWRTAEQIEKLFEASLMAKFRKGDC